MYSNCKDFDKVDIEDKGNGHYQIIGNVLVNHYPESKSSSAYIKGTTKAIKNVSCEDAIQLAINPITKEIPKVKRKSSYKKVKEKMYQKDKQCKICGTQILWIEDCTLDHIIPISKGGLNNSNNYQLAHERCNQNKGNEILVEDKRLPMNYQIEGNKTIGKDYIKTGLTIPPWEAE